MKFIKPTLFLIGLSLLSQAALQAELQLSISPDRSSDPNKPLVRELTISNDSNEPAELDIQFSIQPDPQFAVPSQVKSSSSPIEIPSTGSVVDQVNLTAQVGANESKTIELKSNEPLEVGFYLLGATISDVGQNQYYLITVHQIVLHEALPEINADSRFGMNVSNLDYIDMNRRLGVGWIRFENLKWAFINPGKDQFAFDGSVGPWHVKMDETLSSYKEAGFQTVGYFLKTPWWASSAPSDVKRSRKLAYPPADYANYADAVFQTIARYGSVEHPESELKSKNKKSGLGTLNMLEFWNEANLNNPKWGFWVGTQPEYFEMFRPAAEAAKKADPDTMISHSSYAGLGLDLVDQLRTYTYEDGSHPLDYTDIINVHLYTGKQLPELAAQDPNAQRTGKSMKGTPRIESDLAALNIWRNQFKPGTEIWLTETGYDVGGPIGGTLRMQAAKLPRALMMSMANGVDKIFWYREKGSDPSMHGGAGLLANDELPQPSWLTFATLIRELHGADRNDCLQLPYPDENIRLYLWKTDQGPVLTAWAIQNGGTVDLPLGKVTQTDAFGYKSEVTLDSPWEVNDFPIYLSGIELSGRLLELKDQAVQLKTAEMRMIEASKDMNYALLDFGSQDSPGLLRGHGIIRPFETYTSEDTYEAGAQNGFSKPARQDGTVGHLARYPLFSDYTRFDANTEFTVELDPGTYEVEGRAKQVSKGELLLQITDASGKTEGYQIGKPEGILPNIGGVFTVKQGPVRIHCNGYMDLSWLSLVEVQE